MRVRSVWDDCAQFPRTTGGTHLELQSSAVPSALSCSAYTKPLPAICVAFPWLGPVPAFAEWVNPWMHIESTLDLLYPQMGRTFRLPMASSPKWLRMWL